ncbi:MAG: hypothetical protein HFP78_01870, partial [Methylococcales symbiont of Hymedesmia sp. n. MRB-2018]
MIETHYQIHRVKKMPIIITTRLMVTTLLLLSGFLLSTASQASSHATAPTANAGDDRNVSDGEQRVILGGSGNDLEDGSNLYYEWTQNSGLTVRLDDRNIPRPSFTAPDGLIENEILVFSLVVTDQSGRNSEADTVTLTVRPTVVGLAVDAGLDQTVTSGDVVTLDASSTKHSSAVFYYFWLSPPRRLSSITDAITTFTAPIVTKDTVLTFQLSAVSINGQDNDTVHITVRPRSALANMPPVAHAGEAQNAFVGATVTLDGRGSSDDAATAGTALRYVWTQTAPSSGIDLNTNRAGATPIRPTFRVPEGLTVGTKLTFSLTVIDAGNLRSRNPAEVTITITENQPATLVSGHLVEFITEDDAGTAGTLTFMDPDGPDTVRPQYNVVTRYGTFGINTIGEWIYTLDNTNTDVNALATFNTLLASTELLDSITVMTADGTEKTILIFIRGVNDAPTAMASAVATTVVEGGTVDLQGTGTDPDTNDDTLTYTWTQSPATTPSLIAGMKTEKNPSFMALDVTGVYTFSLVVSDGIKDSTPSTVVVTIDPLPTVTSIERTTPPDAVTNADTLTWTVTFSEDVQGVDSDDFMVSGTSGTSLDTTTFDFNVVPTSDDASIYRVEAIDSDLASFNGDVTLGFKSGHNIADMAATTNRLTDTAPTGTNNPTYTLDNTGPTVTIVRSDGATTPVSSIFVVTFNFNEEVTGFDEDDIDVTNGEIVSGSFRGASPQYTATIAPLTLDGGSLADGDEITVTVLAGRVEDTVGNENADATELRVPFTPADTTAPRVTSIVRTTPPDAVTNANS